MAKLIEDPKVAALVEKATVATQKAAAKAAATAIKDTLAPHIDEAKMNGSKDVAKLLAGLGKELQTAVKEVVLGDD